MNSKKGFTLIELLVVIAIIAILAAILFPVFAQAREKARATSCLSNCKQMGTAMQLYVDDYDETYPLKFYTKITPDVNLVDGKTIKHPATDFTSAKWAEYNIYVALYPYIKNSSMYVCPSYKDYYGYGYNPYLGGFVDWNNTDPDTMYPPAVSEIKNTSETVAFADATIAKNNCTVLNTAPYLLSPSPTNFDSGLTKDKYDYGCRHNSGSNFTMADGHAKFYKWGQGPTEKASKGQADAWGSGDPWFNFRKQ